MPLLRTKRRRGASSGDQRPKLKLREPPVCTRPACVVLHMGRIMGPAARPAVCNDRRDAQIGNHSRQSVQSCGACSSKPLPYLAQEENVGAESSPSLLSFVGSKLLANNDFLDTMVRRLALSLLLVTLVVTAASYVFWPPDGESVGPPLFTMLYRKL